MTGKAHLCFGCIAAADCAAAALMAGKAGFWAAHPETAGALSCLLVPSGPAAALTAAACGIAYLVGLLAPDLDTDGLLANRTGLRLPLAHRGWTHTLWAAAAVFWAGLKLWFPLRYLGLGILVHDLADSLSQAGWVPFYPFGKWRVVHGTVMKRGRTPALYSSADPSGEAVVNGMFAAVSLACALFGAYLLWWPR